MNGRTLYERIHGRAPTPDNPLATLRATIDRLLAEGNQPIVEIPAPHVIRGSRSHG